MGYNLPPGRGGGGGLNDILPGIVTLAGLTLFFFSPLGGIFFAVTNTLFAFAFLTPFLFIVGFQLWQFFNTIEGPCPNCGSPVRVLKEDGGQASLCLNCGSLVRSNRSKDGLELCNDPADEFERQGGIGSVFDELFGGRGFGSFSSPGQDGYTIVEEEDIFTTISRPAGRSNVPTSAGKDKTRRERTIIDVDIEEE